MKSKIQTILLMGLALTSMGSIAASDKKSELIQSGFDIFQLASSSFGYQTLSIQAILMENCKEFTTQLLKNGSLDKETEKEVLQPGIIPSIINNIATAAFGILSTNKPELGFVDGKPTHNDLVTLCAQYYYQKITFPWITIEANGTTSYADDIMINQSTKAPTIIYEKIEFKKTVFYGLLKQYKASEELITALMAIMGPIPNFTSQTQNLEYCGIKGSSKDCLLAFEKQVKIILNCLNLKELDESNGVITYKLNENLHTFGKEQETNPMAKQKYIPFDEDMKNMGKTLGSLIDTKDDRNEFVKGINETVVKDVQIGNNSLKTNIIIGAVGVFSFASGVGAQKGYDSYTSKDNKTQSNVQKNIYRPNYINSQN